MPTAPCGVCKDTNRRGETLKEVVFLQNLAILNDGSTPTFVNHLTREGTRPDVTLCSPQLEACITSWRVDEATPGSDHSLILFDIRLAIPPDSWRRNYRKGDWKLFQTCMESSSLQIPPEWVRRTPPAGGDEHGNLKWRRHLNGRNPPKEMQSEGEGVPMVVGGIGHRHTGFFGPLKIYRERRPPQLTMPAW